MRKPLALILILSIFIVNIVENSIISYADWQSNLNSANKELSEDTNFKTTPDLYSSDSLNTDVANNIWGGLKSGSANESKDIGQAFTYGEPYGYDSSKNPPWRYLGKTNSGEDFTNPYFPHDAWGGGFLEDRNWIATPWKAGYCNQPSKFDVPNLKDTQKYRKSIIKGLEMFYGSILGTEYMYKDWENYVHILQPPTYSSQGLGRMWHTINGQAWYITVPLAKLQLVTTSTPAPTSTPTPTATPLAQSVDFTIKEAATNTNITDSYYQYNISPLDYGQTHTIKLSYSNSIANVSSITFADSTGTNTYTLIAPNTVQSVNVIGAAEGILYQYTMTVKFTDNSTATKTHYTTIAEVSTKPTPTPKPTSTPTAIPSPSPTLTPLIPIALISCPSEVGVGQTFTASLSSSYTRSGGTIVRWVFDYHLDTKNDPSPVTANFTENNPNATFKCMKPGIAYIRGWVKDSNDLESLYSDEVKVTVTEPEPYISLNVPIYTKELRKFSADISNSGTSCDEYYTAFSPPDGHYTTGGIDWTLTNITIKTDTNYDILPSDQVYYEYWDDSNTRHIGQVSSQPLCGAKKFNIMAKKQIKLKITGVAYDILGHPSDPTSCTITIFPDLKPHAELDFPAQTYRTVFNTQLGIFEDKVDIVSLSYSPDEDHFEYQNFYYRADSDNDGDFNEETIFPIDNPTNDNHVQVVYRANQLFKYQYFVEVKEDLPDSVTIPEYILPSDYKIELGYKISTN